MSESSCIDSPLGGLAMPKAYSGDLRERVIEAVETGASRHEAAERFEVSVSSADQMAAALAREQERRAEATRRKHFAPGRVRHRDFDSGFRAAGPDPGRNGRSAVQAADQNQPQLALAVSRPTRHHLKKKPAGRRATASGCRTSAST